MSRIIAVGAVLATLLLFNFIEAQNIRRSCYPTYRVVERVDHVEKVIVPYVLPVEITKDYYFSINDYYRDKILVDAVAGRVVELWKGEKGEVIPKLTPPEKTSTAVPEGLVKVVEVSCIKCHGPTTPGGRVDLSDLGSVDPGLRWYAHGLVNSGEMPKGVAALKDEEVLLFYEWAKLGSKAARKAK